MKQLTKGRKKKRFNVRVIDIVCGDCKKKMLRWTNPYEQKEEHFETKCPKCGMHIRHYEKTFYCINEHGRIYLEIIWDKDLDWKKEFLQKEENMWAARNQRNKEMDEFNKAMDAEILKDMKEAKNNGSNK
ncbi:hypothetical protein LCGC14_0885520 [marine sediment metagenome]|uniref:Uncharacterized protein n=1 Tax=marine sediment metagenome TaxID=412755 RepID=A0A0F9P0Q3_9ZZZZ